MTLPFDSGANTADNRANASVFLIEPLVSFVLFFFSRFTLDTYDDIDFSGPNWYDVWCLG